MPVRFRPVELRCTPDSSNACDESAGLKQTPAPNEPLVEIHDQFIAAAVLRCVQAEPTPRSCKGNADPDFRKHRIH